jgi:hypothetical protein
MSPHFHSVHLLMCFDEKSFSVSISNKQGRQQP